MLNLTLDGDNIFGVALECRHAPRPTIQQIAAFFGISGVQAIWGGTRGRAFMIRGIFIASDVASVRAFESVLETYADGVPRTLNVTYSDGTSFYWDNVIYMNEYVQQGDPRPNINTGGWQQVYTMVLHGLT